MLTLTLATLKNDDAEDDKDEEGDEGDDALVKESNVLRLENAKRTSELEKQPTGRIVGIIKRNWRACVNFVSYQY